MNIYKDIETRTNGEIYIGVVGPVYGVDGTACNCGCKQPETCTG